MSKNVQVTKKIRSAVTAISSASNSISLVIIFLVMFLVSADIIGRFVFNLPVPGTYNIVETLMVFIVFFALANAEAKRQNIRIQVVTSRLSPRIQYILDIIVSLCGILFCGLITWRTWPLAMESWSIREFMTGPVSLPLYPSKFAVPIGTFLLMIQFISDLISNIVTRFRVE